MLVFVLNQAQKTNTGKIQTPVYENVREFGVENIRTPIPFTQNLSLEKVREAVIRGGLAKG